MKPHFYPARPKQGGQNFLDLCQTLYADGTWSFEPKFNGWRAMLHVPSGAMFNRYNEPLSINGEFGVAANKIRAHRWFAVSDPISTEWLDVEALERRHGRGQGSLVAIDLPSMRLTSHTFRSVSLNLVFPPATLDHCAERDTVYSIPSYDDGPSLWRELQAANQQLGIVFYEGVVAKRKTSAYPLQLRSSKEETPDWIKHRFTTS